MASIAGMGGGDSQGKKGIHSLKRTEDPQLEEGGGRRGPRKNKAMEGSRGRSAWRDARRGATWPGQQKVSMILAEFRIESRRPKCEN